MKHLALVSFAAACGASNTNTKPAVHVAASFEASSSIATSSPGNVTAAAAPDRSADEIAALRAEGPAALARLLKTYDALAAGDAKQRLGATIDKVAGQRFATVSRMYWYTDLEAAKAEAKQTGKPILSLRMLGRLDEDLSCANSRFFRTILYSNATLGPWLRDHFVLHWSSERNVPKVTIDFGDGRVLERTVTGNSAHFVLDSSGRPLDVLPGLYAPSAFQEELTKSLALAAQVGDKTDAERRKLVIAYHAKRISDRSEQWQKLGGSVPVIYGRRGLLSSADVDATVALAQRATVSKAYIEVPDLRIVDVGSDPGALAPDLELWAVIGQRLYHWGDPPVGAPAAADEASLNGFAFGRPPREQAPRRAAPHAPTTPLHLLDAQSTSLVLALANAPGAPPLDDARKDQMLARLDQTLAADTAQNEMQLRTQIDSYFAYDSYGGDVTFGNLDEYIYANVFHTPASDPWLGLLPRDAFTGLPADGVTTKAR
ncbi:MAG TPA: hypothetical protein VL463_15445 [Kofleriaceae bacterium]|nr:hypothetical protein [Kofleriaceae bacterium]